MHARGGAFANMIAALECEARSQPQERMGHYPNFYTTHIQHRDASKPSSSTPAAGSKSTPPWVSGHGLFVRNILGKLVKFSSELLATGWGKTYSVADNTGHKAQLSWKPSQLTMATASSLASPTEAATSCNMRRRQHEREKTHCAMQAIMTMPTATRYVEEQQ